MPTMLNVNAITVDPEIQQRAKIDGDRVDEYTECLDSLPPVIVFKHDDKHYLTAGFHRYNAFRKAGRTQIPCEIREGTKRDAILFAVGDNSDHGLPRSRQDKTKAVTTLLDDEEWSGWSTQEIAKRANVGWHFVNELRSERQPRAREPQSEMRKGADGKQYPSKLERKSDPDDSTPTKRTEPTEPARVSVPERKAGSEPSAAVALRHLPAKIGKCIRDVEQQISDAGLIDSKEFRAWLDATNDLFALVGGET